MSFNYLILRPNLRFCFVTLLIVRFVFVFSSPSPFKQLYFFDLNATNSIIISPPNSFSNNPIIFLFFPLGIGFSNTQFVISDLALISQYLWQCLRKFLLFLWKPNCYTYPCNIILFLLYTSVSCNHVKTHTFLFHISPISTNLNRLI